MAGLLLDAKSPNMNRRGVWDRLMIQTKPADEHF
jgi:hypothetical protein